ncbi:hypothetical protein ME3_01324, partial [Bartonella melophagi K-2C]
MNEQFFVNADEILLLVCSGDYH